MRYTNGAPDKVYAVVDTEGGTIMSVHTRLAEAREAKRFDDAHGCPVIIATYDQRKKG